MDAVLTKVQSAKDEMIQLTVVMPRKNATVDMLDYVDKVVEIRIPDGT